MKRPHIRRLLHCNARMERIRLLGIAQIVMVLATAEAMGRILQLHAPSITSFCGFIAFLSQSTIPTIGFRTGILAGAARQTEYERNEHQPHCNVTQTNHVAAPRNLIDGACSATRIPSILRLDTNKICSLLRSGMRSHFAYSIAYTSGRGHLCSSC
jgi:hypothetical protein